MIREPNLADLLAPTFSRSPTLPVITTPQGELVLVVLTETPNEDLVVAVALQQALERGVLVLC